LLQKSGTWRGRRWREEIALRMGDHGWLTEKKVNYDKNCSLAIILQKSLRSRICVVGTCMLSCSFRKMPFFWREWLGKNRQYYGKDFVFSADGKMNFSRIVRYGKIFIANERIH
jgi:hypothetical protein